MSRAHDEQTIALAAMFQAASLVDQIANRGMVAQNSLETSIYSLFVTDPKITEDIFGGVHDLPFNLSMGLKALNDVVEKKKDAKANNVTNYVLSMIMLEQKLSKNKDMLNIMGKRIDETKEKARYFNPEDENALDNPSSYTHSNVIANVASLYQDTISSFSFRIQVGGDPRHLQNAENAARIRALLLAGIRAAMLWRQVGGKRWHLLFFRSRLRPSLRKIMA
ncbi:high frequency lysogenization protein HflD [Neptunomonas qingdaonensis]|uniref:High frequency lysogenization protein HflD homolog n=1 Tax=Neptunomonas qingdaonensis TaxID=1045558 RepID=A0A1I2RPC4_9GAMM|nr:high frequency lysogenization protein HflD [Neptunomonas qingdaonensis]SFG39616.1 high frequency lysogenization protein [Neptunomonas qingdaonensis]